MMKDNFSKKILSMLIISLFFVGISCYNVAPRRLFIRINQVGYYADDIKIANVFSDTILDDVQFQVKDAKSHAVLYKGTVGHNLGKWGNFGYNYTIDFSSVKTEGSCYIEAAGNRSYDFKISSAPYVGVLDSLLTFFRVQRCGPTSPYLHGVCHLYDSPNVEGDNSLKGIDVTGGWHDAGDYTKFMTTAALSTYCLLLSYDSNHNKLEFDRNHNGAPDILDEARVGLDWLLRCNYAKDKLIIEVQDRRDQTVGWRLPENDTLKYERPAFAGMGKNQIGMYVAALSLASKIWKDRFKDKEFSDKCLKTAEAIYALRNSAPDVDKNPIGLYQDSRWWGKLALGATELYKATNNRSYLNDAIDYDDKAGADYWWSWGDVNALAHYRIAPYYQQAINYLLQSLSAFNENSNKNIFGEGSSFSWGTTNTFFGIGLHAAMYKKLTGSLMYDTLAVKQVDYILGKNPWGVSFIYGLGSQFTRNFHSQVANFNGGYLPGGVAAGPAPLAVLQCYNIKRTINKYNQFNTDSVFYYDDRNDYITNEPTIVTNATAILFFSLFH